ncbi:acyltransferase family protein [Variovorax sp. J22P240]|uniref:acyltransferase family protein n=1 Tax=Variovorax sp. J22P240 TaxID=3053514 RepID=UPI002578F1F6|nr:acyltransferase family protein [Variovorax sp. J22P240]MDL9998088.1 acyltransferase family protein [Variovorax sp. J22P240]
MRPFTSNTADFRDDINGLRAWAVLAVILYHFGIPGFGGGFVGVDVFFVISGFLMTGIVVGGLERNGAAFSVLSFYFARARRIFPALIALCAAMLAAGWWLLLQPDYRKLGSDAVFSLLFLSNFKFWREAGYFDVASHEKLLLHTWSLSVEWQFYLLLPLALLVLWKWRPGRGSVVVLMSLGLMVSLAVAVGVTPFRPTAAFYLLPARAWEMFAGGLVYLLSQRWAPRARQRMALEVGGFVMIAGAIVAFDSSSSWPGWRAVVPVLGAVGVLVAARSRSPFTARPLAQWLGTRSYSLYLWHWPVWVALNYVEGHAAPGAIAGGLVLTLVLGNLSYRLVELPTRAQLGRFRTSWATAALLFSTAAIAASGAWVYLKQGVTGRFPAQVDLAALESENFNPYRSACHAKGGVKSPSCVLGGNRIRAILLGDSHAEAVFTAVAAAVPDREDGVIGWTYTNCPTLLSVKYVSPTSTSQCARFLEWAMGQLADAPEKTPLIIVNRSTMYAAGYNEPWEEYANRPSVYFSRPYAAATPEFLKEYAQHLTDTACELAKDRPVFLVRPIPEMGVDVPKAMSRAFLLGKSKDVSISLVDYQQRHAVVLQAQDAARERCGVRILDPVPYLCPDGRCHGAKEGRPLYYDDDHLSEYGNRLLVPMFATVFASASWPGTGAPAP